jgi:hypothetical protein
MIPFNVKGTCIAAGKIAVTRPRRTRPGLAGLGYGAGLGEVFTFTEAVSKKTVLA